LLKEAQGFTKLNRKVRKGFTQGLRSYQFKDALSLVRGYALNVI